MRLKASSAQAYTYRCILSVHNSLLKTYHVMNLDKEEMEKKVLPQGVAHEIYNHREERSK